MTDSELQAVDKKYPFNEANAQIKLIGKISEVLGRAQTNLPWHMWLDADPVIVVETPVGTFEWHIPMESKDWNNYQDSYNEEGLYKALNAILDNA